ncbi:hypothetical protein F4804DRAFT_322659 [Jackrogersella minutella]|nr:hypothetical protein F4804DRAFT_322659 [Jackrogersella minutella]
MLVIRLRPLLPRLITHFPHHGHAKFRSAFQSSARHASRHRQGLMLGSRYMSTTAQSPGAMGTGDISSARETEKPGDSQAVTTTPGDEEATVTTANRNVAILWDLDNKKPLALPEDVANEIRSLASERGKIIEYSAIANRHAFAGLPIAAQELQNERKRMLKAEQQGKYKPAEPCVCPMCGRKCDTHYKLKKHYKQLHENERRKKLIRLDMLKGKKKEKFRETLKKRNIVHAMIHTPERSHKVWTSLMRVGVDVQEVKKVAQAADRALMSRFSLLKKDSDLTLVVISDDSDFCAIVKKAKNEGVHVIVISDYENGKMAKAANEWFSWASINDRTWNTDIPTLRSALEIKESESENDELDFEDDYYENEINEELLNEIMINKWDKF